MQYTTAGRNTNLLQTSLEGQLGDLQIIGGGDDLKQNVELVLVLVDLCFAVRQHANCRVVDGGW